MAEILPFRALEYSQDRVRIDQVVTQPYDKISPEMERRYLDSHAHNIVRIIRPGSNPAAEPGLSPYEHAARTFSDWRRSGVVRQVSDPSLYTYFQRFRMPGSDQVRTRKGFIGLIRLEDYANRVVFPHERTLTGPKEDRLELLRKTRTHFGQVFLLYSDPDSRVDAVLDRVQSTSPDVTVRDEYGADHLLWRMSDSSSIGAIRKEMADKPVVIADGHHRYETALAFRDERRREAGSTTGGSSDWLMATMVNMDSPGMTILPTHRLLTGFDGLNRDALIRSARAYFDVTEVRGRDALERALRENGASRPSIGLAVGESAGLFLFTLRADVEAARVVDGVSAAQSMLDVVILHRLVLEKCLGISEDQVRGETYLRYIRGFGDAIEQVRTGRAQVAFLLNATRLDQVRDIAFSGEVLPQKSTDFFPKLLTGLTMYGMD